MGQDKNQEIEFFSRHADTSIYDVFTPEANAKIMDTFQFLSELKEGSLVADFGCGSGVYTELLRKRNYRPFGVDLSHKLQSAGRTRFPQIPFVTSDVEKLPLADNSVDGILLSGLVHHFPDPTLCAREVYRVLKPGGSFVAFDPNRRNPMMWLYRDHSSPFYSSKGVTPNERPIIAQVVADTFTEVGFQTNSHFLSGLKYKFVADSLVSWALPLYNVMDSILFSPGFMAPLRSFVFTYGKKPEGKS